MNFSLVILCISLSIFSCEGATLDYSNITPWSVVYAIYPSVQNPDLWVEVWKNEGTLDVSTDNVVEIRSNDREKTDSLINKKISDNNDSLQQNTNSGNRNNQNLNSNQQIQTQLWPLNYRNWPKSSNKPSH